MRNAACCLLAAVLFVGCAAAHGTGDVSSVQLVRSTKSWNGRPLPAYPAGTPEITILKITIPPGYTLPVHMHPVINAGVLIKGELTVKTESGHVLHMKPYDPIVEVVDTWHYGTNEGTEPAEIIVFYAGQKGEPITVKKKDYKRLHHSPHADGGR